MVKWKRYGWNRFEKKREFYKCNRGSLVKSRVFFGKMFVRVCGRLVSGVVFCFWEGCFEGDIGFIVSVLFVDGVRKVCNFEVWFVGGYSGRRVLYGVRCDLWEGILGGEFDKVRFILILFRGDLRGSFGNYLI